MDYKAWCKLRIWDGEIILGGRHPKCNHSVPVERDREGWTTIKKEAMEAEAWRCDGKPKNVSSPQRGWKRQRDRPPGTSRKNPPCWHLHLKPCKMQFGLLASGAMRTNLHCLTPVSLLKCYSIKGGKHYSHKGNYFPQEMKSQYFST